jgi:hypothetical protein
VANYRILLAARQTVPEELGHLGAAKVGKPKVANKPQTTKESSPK